MTTALFTHPDSHLHVTPPGHPERVARIEAIDQILSLPEFDALDRRAAPLVAAEDLLRCHPQEYIDYVVSSVPETGWASLDGDTHLSPTSLNAVYRSAGAATAAVDLVLEGGATNAFCAMRPCGHHAERDTAMGFCFFGNVAVAAKRALDHHGLERVAVVDFDVHHGNGTQDLLWEDARAFFVSTHQSPLYPGTGARNERGRHGQMLNMPFPPHTAGDTYRDAFAREAMPFLEAAKPDLVIVSAGFDAHAADPLANMALVADDFRWVTAQLCDLADTHCAGRLVSALEGGYDLTGLAESTAAHVTELMTRGD
ncbi:MAG: histone deacetylase family protein [Pseudomonadota bacterium]